MIKMIGQSFSIIAGWIVGMAVLNTAFCADVAQITPFISPRTIKNGSIVYPSSQAYVDLLQRSGYLFKPETENYLQHFRAPVFHALSPYYVVQRNSSSCSLASATIILNAVRDIQDQCSLATPATQNEILEMVDNPQWDRATADDGPGMNLDQFGQFLQEVFLAYKIDGVAIQVNHVKDRSEKTRQKIHEDLMSLFNETGVTTLLVLNFDDRCFINTKENVGHISPVGGYDPHSNLVLVLDVDREWTGPYWITEETLLNGLNTLNNEEKSAPIAYRGYVCITLC